MKRLDRRTESRLPVLNPEHQRLLGLINPPSYGLLLRNLRDPTHLRIAGFREMPVNLVARVVDLTDRIEWDNFAQFVREELEQVLLVRVRSNRFGQTDQRFILGRKRLG